MDGRTWNDCLRSLAKTLPKDVDAAFRPETESQLASLEFAGTHKGERCRWILEPDDPKESACAIFALTERLSQEGVAVQLTRSESEGGRLGGWVCEVRVPVEGLGPKVRTVHGESYLYAALVGLEWGFLLLSRKGDPHPYRDPPGWSRENQYAHMFRPGDPGGFAPGSWAWGCRLVRHLGGQQFRINVALTGLEPRTVEIEGEDGRGEPHRIADSTCTAKLRRYWLETEGEHPKFDSVDEAVEAAERLA